MSPVASPISGGGSTGEKVSQSPRASNASEPLIQESAVSPNRESNRTLESPTEQPSVHPTSGLTSPTKEHSNTMKPSPTIASAPSSEEPAHIEPSTSAKSSSKILEQPITEPSPSKEELTPAHETTTTMTEGPTQETTEKMDAGPRTRSLRSKSAKKPSQAATESMDTNEGTRSVRKRKREVPPVDELMRPLTEEERQNWLGWAEIESEPALFNHILKAHGVKDVKIKELMLGIDEEFLTMLPKPIYGLIFLFKYRDVDDETEDLPKCPQNIWFANQIASNSCATVAMLNILMNVPGIDLGETLSLFKAATRLKKPPYRGRDLKNNAAIRIIHNTFVRRVEVLNADLYLQNEADKWSKSLKSKKRKPATQKKTAKQKKAEEEDSAYHFLAYVPIMGEVWRMDGMQRNPVNLGKYDSNNWLSVARDNIYEQMAAYPEDQSYNFMAVCKNPLTIIKAELASNARSLHDVESKLSSIDPDWHSSLPQLSPTLASQVTDLSTSNADTQTNDLDTSHEPSPPRELSDSYGLTEEIILAAEPNPVFAHKLEAAGDDVKTLLMLRSKIALEEKRLAREWNNEVMEDSDEEEKAKLHMIDYGPAMYKMVRTLLDNGTLKEVWDEL